MLKIINKFDSINYTDLYFALDHQESINSEFKHFSVEAKLFLNKH